MKKCPYLVPDSGAEYNNKCAKEARLLYSRLVNFCETSSYEACKFYPMSKTPLLDIRPEEWKEESPLTITSIMAYELGDFIKCCVKAVSYSDPKVVAAYECEGKLALSDLLAMVEIMCEMRGWKFDEVRKLGVERYVETMQLVKAKKRSY